MFMQYPRFSKNIALTNVFRDLYDRLIFIYPRNARYFAAGNSLCSVTPSYEAGDYPNAFLIGSIFNNDSRIVLKEEIEKEYKFYCEQFEKRMVAIGVY